MTVFISHSRQNAGAALRLTEKLRQSGLAVWLDLLELESGADWESKVGEAIGAADGFVILVGPAADTSQRFEWQRLTELEYYLDPQKPIIPILIGSPEVPGFLRTRQAVTVDPSAIDFDDLSRRIVQAMGAPGETVDQEQMERGRVARQRALDSLKEYSLDLEKSDVKQAGLRGLKR
jgi:hypothetical protein